VSEGERQSDVRSRVSWKVVNVCKETRKAKAKETNAKMLALKGANGCEGENEVDM